MTMPCRYDLHLAQEDNVLLVRTFKTDMVEVADTVALFCAPLLFAYRTTQFLTLLKVGSTVQIFKG